MIAFATISGRTVLHIVPNGNTHSRCGRVITLTVEGPAAGKAITAGTHTVCRTCLRVKAPRDLTVVDMGEPTDVWEVTDKAGEKLGRITARDIHTAGRRACQVPSIDWISRRDGGLSLRRLRTTEIGTATWDVVDETTERVLTRITADDYQAALRAARAALPFTHFDGLILCRV